MDKPGRMAITTPSDLEIVITRAFDAPRRLVWQAMTRPELIRRWLFLPPGWTMTRCDEDVRVGGAYRWEWAGPDGGIAMSMGGVYREVVPHERLVRTEKFEFGCQPQAGEQLATMEFHEQGGVTLVKITVVYPSREARDAALASGMERGMSAGYDQLEALLASGAVH
ncbi:MAG: hypothetical protein AMXMBFR83_05720 [Phycisphaerae bacterium]